jgi:hypothetical protein
MNEIAKPLGSTMDFLQGIIRGLNDDEVIHVVRLCRIEYMERIDEYDCRGDGPMVNAMCAEARKWLSPSLAW